MKLLFLCTHNACRSILAEVITRRLAGDRIQVASAGSQPAGRIHPLTLEQLEKHQFSAQGLTSKSWDDLGEFKPDVVVTVCDSAANEACPLWLNDAIRVHWGLPDPSHQANAALTDAMFTTVIDRLERRIKALLALPLEQMLPEAIGNELNKLGDLS